VYWIKLLDKINPTLVKQYLYCPVIVWITSKLGVVEPVTDSMRLGREATKPPEGRGQVYVSTHRGAAVLDELVEEGKFRVIIERKAYRSHNASRYTAQAVTAYLIVSERIPGIRRARITVENRVLELELSEDLVRDVENIVKLVEEVVKSDKPPSTKPNPKKCTSCWYRKYCPHH